MTKPIKMKTQNYPGINSIPVRRQPPSLKSPITKKKAPAPPPNPALVNPQFNSSAEVKPVPAPQVDQQKVVKQTTPSPESNLLQPPPETQNNYEKCSDGALTYFNYYFDEIATASTSADYARSSTRSRFPVGMVGVGVVAATVTTGLLLGDALKPSDPPQSKQSQDAADQQNTSAQPSRPTTIPPEKLETGRSLSSTPASPLTRTTPARPLVTPLKRSQSAANSLVTSGPLLSNAQPLTLPPLTVSAVTSGVSVPPVPATPPAATSSPPSLASEAVTRAANLPAMTAPEPLTQTASLPVPASPGSLATATPNAAIPGAATETPQAAVNPVTAPFSSPTSPANLSASTTANPGNTSRSTTAFPPGNLSSVPAPDSPSLSAPSYTPTVSQMGAAEAGNRLVNAPVVNPAVNPATPTNQQTTSAAPLMAPGDRLLEAGSPGLNRLTPTALTPTSTSSSQEGIQDYLNRPQKPNTPALALLPLSSKAAGEAVGNPQIGTFTVRQVDQQEYQKEWLTSNRNPSDPAIAYAFPAYGFIDYQRQVIIVLKEQPDTNPLQSKVPNLPNS